MGWNNVRIAQLLSVKEAGAQDPDTPRGALAQGGNHDLNQCTVTKRLHNVDFPDFQYNAGSPAGVVWASVRPGGIVWSLLRHKDVWFFGLLTIASRWALDMLRALEVFMFILGWWPIC